MAVFRWGLRVIEACIKHPLISISAAICSLFIWTVLLPLPFASGAYSISSSLRFNDDDSASLTKTFSSAGTGSGRTATFSFWIKRSNMGSEQFLINWSAASADGIRFTSNDTIYGYAGNGAWSYETNAKFRDPTAWYHVVFVVDSTQATAANRIQLWVNGITQSFSSSGYTSMTQNSDVNVLDNVIHAYGQQHSGTSYYDGYISDFYAIDGQALTPSSFGETDSSTGVWRPKAYSGSYGTNGFHLDFSNSADLGNDVSGNNNDWTTNNLDATDWVKDSPTNNFGVLMTADLSTSATMSQGGLRLTSSSGSYQGARVSIGPESATKLYIESISTSADGAGMFGLRPATSNVAGDTDPGVQSNEYMIMNNGAGTRQLINNNTGTSSRSADSANDVWQLAYDYSTGKLWFGRNNSWFGGGDPALGTAASYTLSTSTQWAIGQWAQTNGSGTFVLNFGQSPNPTSTATTLTYNASAGGYFQYTPPNGFKALSTANLPSPTIAKPSNYFDTKTYVGTGAATTTWSGFFNFQPALVWLKDRTSANAHGIFDSIRAVFPYWSSNSTGAETASASTTLTQFKSDGFSLGGSSLFNTNTNSYIAWAWKEDPTTAGFDIVTYEGNNTANRTISHSLAASTSFAIVKRRDSTGAGYVWHRHLTSNAHFLDISATAAQSNTNSPFGTGQWNSSAFMVTNDGTNNLNANGATYVAYLFKEVEGYSKFGTYTGNGSADGPFIYAGFKPRYILIKRTDSADNWRQYDTARETLNYLENQLFLNLSDADGALVSSSEVDPLSNGFKFRNPNAGNNASGGTYIYAAFAEFPFKEQFTAYNLAIATSTRFDGTSAYISRTPSATGNRKTWTYSLWAKRSALTGTQQSIFFSYPSPCCAGGWTQLVFTDAERLSFDDSNGATVRTNAIYRDPSTWMHVVLALDTTQATAAERVKLYVNGSQITSFESATYPTQNLDTQMGLSGSPMQISFVTNGGNEQYFSGYLSDVYYIDGAALTPSSFGESDTNGNWKPKTYSGSYGTNGFHLPLAGTTTASSIGTDTSGNGNFWTANNLDTTDIVRDSPTNNYSVLSSIDKTSGITLSNGNLGNTGTYGSTGVFNSIALPTTIKTYAEMVIGSPASGVAFGVCEEKDSCRDGFGQAVSNYWAALDNGSNFLSRRNNSDTNTTSTGATNDIFQVAYDPAAGYLWLGRNNTWLGGGNPSAGTSPTYSQVGSTTYNLMITAISSSVSTVNFGQSRNPTSTATSLNYDSASGGYFQYTPPSGFKALTTSNLTDATIPKPSNYFDAKTYVGTGAATTTWSGFFNFQPSLVWLKDRTSANAHGIFDSIRTVFPYWSSNSTGAETNTASTTGVTRFKSDGFDLGAGSNWNTNTNNYVSWAWKRDPTTAGFDIVTYEGNNTSNRTIAHSLAASTSFAIVKRRDSTGSGYVWHKNLTGNTYFQVLSSTAAESNSNSPFGTGQWNSSAFMVTNNGTNNLNANGATYVAYLFKEVEGYSKLGSYIGNGSTDGVFVYTGFKPRYILVHPDGTDWFIYDTARNTYNPVGNELYADATSVEQNNGYSLDALSNGFKLRSASYPNTGVTHIYAAFAEFPFKYANAGITDTTLSGFIPFEF